MCIFACEYSIHLYICIYKYFYITIILNISDQLFDYDFPILKINLWKSKAIVKTGYTSKQIFR